MSAQCHHADLAMKSVSPARPSTRIVRIPLRRLPPARRNDLARLPSGSGPATPSDGMASRHRQPISFGRLVTHPRSHATLRVRLVDAAGWERRCPFDRRMCYLPSQQASSRAQPGPARLRSRRNKFALEQAARPAGTSSPAMQFAELCGLTTRRVLADCAARPHQAAVQSTI